MDAPSTAFDARLKKLESELRCLVCQNQTLADSNADLADDLRREVRELARRRQERRRDPRLSGRALRRFRALRSAVEAHDLAAVGRTVRAARRRRLAVVADAAASAARVCPAPTQRSRRRGARPRAARRRAAGASRDSTTPAVGRGIGASARDWRRSASTARSSPDFPRWHDAAEHAARLRAIGGQRRQHRFGARTVARLLQPDLRLRDVGRHLADDARHVLVEDVRGDAGLLQPMQQQVGVEAVQRGVEAFHRSLAGAIMRGMSRASDGALIRRPLQLPAPRVGADGIEIARARHAEHRSARDGSA